MKTITTSPHIHSGASTKRIMLDVSIALLPSCIWGVYLFGLRALLVLAVSLISSVVFEVLFKRISNDKTIDYSSIVTGLLIGMNMPSTIPLFIPIIASFFAIVVVKWTFGGLGANWANPALAGRVFVFFSFTSAMSTFEIPKKLSIDALSTASPLSLMKTVTASGNLPGLSSLEVMKFYNYPISDFSQRISSSININPYNLDALIGFKPGCIGEVSAILLILGLIYLLVRKVITWHIPVSYLAFFGLLTWIFGGLPNNCGLFTGEVIPSILRGGLLLGAFFMATDYVTTPITHKGQLIFGFGCAFFTFLFRSFGSLAEATSVAILLMNIVTPTIDKFCKPRLFGDVSK